MTIINDIRIKDRYVHNRSGNRELLGYARILYYYPGLRPPLLEKKGNLLRSGTAVPKMAIKAYESPDISVLQH